MSKFDQRILDFEYSAQTQTLDDMAAVSAAISTRLASQ
jgi:hypothetical protein